MNWVIIILIFLAIIGSMMWMMPSPRQRVQALLRQKAMRSGLQVQLTRTLFPRATGEAAPEEYECVAYRLGRPRANRRGQADTLPWHIFKVRNLANRGLPDGWCWSKGEGYFEGPQLELIAELIRELPADVYSIESTPVAVSVFWNEKGDLETVDLIHRQLSRMIEARI